MGIYERTFDRLAAFGNNLTSIFFSNAGLSELIAATDLPNLDHARSDIREDSRHDHETNKHGLARGIDSRRS